MWWLWEMATGLYPRMYMNYNPNQTTSMTNGVWNQVTEAVRIQSTFSPPNTEIYPYCNLQRGLNFFPRDYLDIILRLPADMGASGIVLWGSSSSYRNPLQCPLLQAHIRDVLGPYVKELTSFMTNCSSELCGGHGRCVHNGRDSLLDQKRSVELSNQCQKDGYRFHDYHCRCYAFWSGACCSDFQASKLAACQQTAAISGQDHVTGNHGHVTPTKESGVLIGR